jgi:hypothetical protein
MSTDASPASHGTDLSASKLFGPDVGLSRVVVLSRVSVLVLVDAGGKREGVMASKVEGGVWVTMIVAILRVEGRGT